MEEIGKGVYVPTAEELEKIKHEVFQKNWMKADLEGKKFLLHKINETAIKQLEKMKNYNNGDNDVKDWDKDAMEDFVKYFIKNRIGEDDYEKYKDLLPNNSF